MTTSMTLRPCRVGRQSKLPRQLNLKYHAFGAPTNRASCRCSPAAESDVTRAEPENPIIVIPARLASTRLPGKPLADIAGTPMIVRVWRRAVAAEIGPVVVACGDREIADEIEAAGGRAVMTDPAHPTGSDRIHEAIAKLDPDGAFDAVINVQGDLPLLDPAAVRVAFSGLGDPDIDIATLAAVIEDAAALADTSVNKVVAG